MERETPVAKTKIANLLNNRLPQSEAPDYDNLKSMKLKSLCIGHNEFISRCDVMHNINGLNS